MKEIKQSTTFIKWFRKLKDRKARAAILVRVDRLAEGHLGDVKPVKGAVGIQELRVHLGPGYRVYFREQDGQIIILLCGGDKSSQIKDIKKAIQIDRELSE